MRGRTNVPGGGMSINAGVEEYKVANGSTVTAGDFVEYMTTVSEKTLISTKFTTYYHTQIGNNLCVDINNDSLCLLKQTSNGLDIVDAYNDYTVLDYAVLANGDIAVCVVGTPYIVRLRVSNDSFQTVCDASGIPEGSITSNNKCVLAEHNGTIYLLITMFEYKTSSYKMYISAYKFDATNSSKISYLGGGYNSEAIDRFGSVDSRSTRIVKAMFLGNDLYIITAVESGSSSTVTHYYVSKVNISDTALNLSDITLMSIDSYTKGPVHQCPIPFYNKYILWEDREYLCIYNIKSKINTGYSLRSFGFEFYSGINASSEIVFSAIGSDKIAVFSVCGSFQSKYIQNAVFKISQGGIISLESNILVPNLSKASSDIGSIYLEGTINDLVYYDRSATMSHAVSYQEIGELITEKVRENYVKPYSKGLSIGVAKQSGRNGQTIEVYVPTPV